MPRPPEHQPTRKEVDETINEESEVDEAAFESFPASDPPALTDERSRRFKPNERPEEDAEDDDAGADGA